MAYAFKQIEAHDPNNPGLVAPNAMVTIFEPGDPAMTPLTLTTLTGQALANPVKVNGLGYGPAFMHATLPQVAWAGGGLTGTFESYEGMRDEAIGARTAAENAAANAALAAQEELEARIAAGEFKGEPGQNGTNGAQGLPGVNAVENDTAVAGYISAPTSATKTALSAAVATVPAVVGKTDANSSPRDTFRVKKLRKPVAVVDKQFPNAHVDHDIVWVETGSMYGIGKDRSLYNSIDRGYTWSSKISNSGTAGKWGLNGLFRKTTAGSLITTYDPDDLSASSIVRSTNNGSTWTTVVPAKTGVGYLGGGALCQDLNTGYLYLMEYTVADTATVPTAELLRSTNDGATWSSFKSWPRTGAGFIRHGHTVQYDPISQRVYILTGDGEDDGGIYRVNAAGTDVEPVVLNKTITGGPTHTGADATAVGVMFFPDYIAWGMDGSADSYLLRMNRNQIGLANQQVEQVMRLQNTAWWATRAKADGTGWYMSVSGPAGGTGPDDLTHLYYVSDNGASCDQVLTVTGDAVASSALGPVGTPLQTGSTIWLSARQRGDAVASPRNSAFQVGVQLGWGDVPMVRPDNFNKPYYAPQHRGSGKLTSTAVGQIQTFGETDVPANARRLYILNMGAYTVGGTGSVKVTVNNLSTGGTAVPIKGTAVPIESGSRDWRTQNGMETAPYIMVSDLLTATHRVEFRMHCTAVTTSVDAHAFIDFAWGF